MHEPGVQGTVNTRKAPHPWDTQSKATELVHRGNLCSVCRSTKLVLAGDKTAAYARAAETARWEVHLCVDLFRGYRHPHITVVRRTVGINEVRELRVEISVALIWSWYEFQPSSGYVFQPPSGLAEPWVLGRKGPLPRPEPDGLPEKRGWYPRPEPGPLPEELNSVHPKHLK